MLENSVQTTLKLLVAKTIASHVGCQRRLHKPMTHMCQKDHKHSALSLVWLNLCFWMDLYPPENAVVYDSRGSPMEDVHCTVVQNRATKRVSLASGAAWREDEPIDLLPC